MADLNERARCHHLGRSARGAFLALLLATATACTASPAVAPAGSPDPTTTMAVPAERGLSPAASASRSSDEASFRRQLQERLTLPSLPDFTIPTDILTSADNQQIARQLDVLPGLYRGIAVLDARCGADGVPLAADSGRAAAAAVAGPASARDGDVSITVAGDGTGVYDAPGLHIAVLADGSGVYDDGQVRLNVRADGAGTYTDAHRRYFVRADGSGSYRDDSTRVWLGPTGAGSYDGPGGSAAVDEAGVVTGSLAAGPARAVAAVLAQGLPRFSAVPRIRRVAPVGQVCGTVLRLDAGVLFGFDSRVVRPDAQALLTKVAGLLSTVHYPDADVVGHTDSTGTPEYNQRLSEGRARSVVEQLVVNGVPRASLHPSGRGETEPVQPETGPTGGPDPAAQRLNRRVEIILRSP